MRSIDIRSAHRRSRRVLIVLRWGCMLLLSRPRSHGCSVRVRLVVWRDNIDILRLVSATRSGVMNLRTVVL